MPERPWQRHYDPDVPTTIRYPHIPVTEMLNIPAKVAPDKAAFLFRGAEISFYEFRTHAFALANALAALGVGKGDRVGVMLPTCPQYPIAYHAVLALGAIVVNLNPLYTAHELRYIIEHTGLRTIIATDSNREKLEALSGDVELRHVVLARIADFSAAPPPEPLKLPDGWRDFSELLRGANSKLRPIVDVQASDPAQIQFTGGTTGVPKGATLTHFNVVAAMHQVSKWGGASLMPIERRNVLVAIPYYHVYANVCCLGLGVASMTTQILMDRFDVDEILDVLAAVDHVGYFPAVPTMIGAVMNHPRAEGLELDRKIGRFGSGGGPMPVELIERVRGCGITFGEGWGMSETTSLGIANPILNRSKDGTIGIPFPDTDVRVVDPEDPAKDVEVGEPGELLIKSPLVMRGYWDDPEKTTDQLRDGWLFTGDIVVRDEDDYFSIVDRKKDMVIAGGFNIYPREVDETLYQHPKVLEACSVGVPDDYRGETLKAFVVVRDGETLTQEELTGFCRERLTAYKVPKLWEFRESLPKSAVGKVLRRMLREGP